MEPVHREHHRTSSAIQRNGTFADILFFIAISSGIGHQRPSHLCPWYLTKETSNEENKVDLTNYTFRTLQTDRQLPASFMTVEHVSFFTLFLQLLTFETK